MDATEIATLLSNGIFPIGMCALLFWYMTQQAKDHKEEVNGLKDIISEVRIAIVELRNAIENMQK